MASNVYNLNTYKSVFLAKEPSLTIGNTAKVFNGATSLVWNINEIIGESNNSKFYRGDQSWSNVLNGNFTANGSIYANGGYLQSTVNGNTLTIGSQNNAYCHFMNNADVPFYFNKSTYINGTLGIYSSNTYMDSYDIHAARYVWSQYTNQSCPVENGALTNIIYDNGDGWLRKASYAHICNNLQGNFLRYNGRWTDGNGQSVDNAHGMIFAYSSHGLPGTWGVVTTFDYASDSAYRHQIFGDGYNSEMYFRVRSSDRGGWYGGWKHLIYDGIGHAYIGSYNHTGYALSCSSFICQSWIRTTGATGWYNESYGGGWYMQDSTYIRNYGSKQVYLNAQLGVDATLRLWDSTRQITRASRSVGWINGRDSALMREDDASGYHATVMTKTGNGCWCIGNYNTSGWTNYLLFSYTTDSNYYAGNNTATTIRMRDSGVVESAMWNDYAEYRKADTIESGRVIIETGHDDLILCNKRLAPGGRIISDTYGFVIGQTKDCQTPVAVSGRVLVYPYQDRNLFKPGDAVCTAPNGTVDIMTREEIMMYPDRIVGIVSSVPDYDIWYGGGNYSEDGSLIPIPVKGRIWIYVR